MRKPDCFNTNAQFLEWVEMAAQSKPRGGVDNYCCDCLPAFQARMTRAGRCEHPDVQFVEVEHSGIRELVGMRPAEEETFVAGGREYSLGEFCEEKGINPGAGVSAGTVRRRLRKGMGAVEAVVLRVAKKRAA